MDADSSAAKQVYFERLPFRIGEVIGRRDDKKKKNVA